MCIYSMIADGWRTPPFGESISYPTIGTAVLTATPIGNPNVLPDIFKPSYMPLHLITPEIAKKMLQCLKLLDEIDKETGARDCKLNEQEKKQFTENLHKIAGKLCRCEE